MRRYTSATSFPGRRGFSCFPSLIRSVRPASEPGLLQNGVVHNLHIAWEFRPHTAEASSFGKKLEDEAKRELYFARVAGSSWRDADKRRPSWASARTVVDRWDQLCPHRARVTAADVVDGWAWYRMGVAGGYVNDGLGILGEQGSRWPACAGSARRGQAWCAAKSFPG